MAYFKQNETEETRRSGTVPPDDEYTQAYDYSEGDNGNIDIDADEYDDGLDDDSGDMEFPEDELTEEEKEEERKTKMQLIFGVGDLTGIIIGTVVILLLLAFLFQMINFVRDDIHDFLDTAGRFFR